MEELVLMRPTAAYEAQVMNYRKEMMEHGDPLDGCAGLDTVETFAEWMDFENRLKKTYGEERVLVTCDKINAGSRGTIEKNGGILENEVADEPGLGESGVIQRFWVAC